MNSTVQCKNGSRVVSKGRADRQSSVSIVAIEKKCNKKMRIKREGPLYDEGGHRKERNERSG
jgi:hypothetical protein